MEPKGRCCGDKAVLVSVYVERPRRRRKVVPSSANLHHNLCIREQRLACLKACRNGGYDRKAKLLLYSKKLREAAARQQSDLGTSSTNVRQISSNNRPQPQITKTLSLHRRNTRRSSMQACFGDWKKLFIPGFLRSLALFKWKKNKNKNALSQANKIKTIKSSETKKKWAVIPKLFAKFYKNR